MKFGKLMQSRAEELKSSGLGEHFLRYKALKKQLKQLQKSEPATGGRPSASAIVYKQTFATL